MVNLDDLAILLRQGVKDGLDDVVPVKVGSVNVGVSLLHA
jgi:hypothetical protein